MRSPRTLDAANLLWHRLLQTSALLGPAPALLGPAPALLSLVAMVAVASSLCGCGTPAAPAPPSLNLPVAVSDLSAVRAGDMVTFTWTEPRRTTDRLLLKKDMNVVLCRKLPTGDCAMVNDFTVTPGGLAPDPLAPGAEARAEIHLPSELSSGAPRPLLYAIQVRNRAGRSAGLSNTVEILAGQAPPLVKGLAAEVTRQGVVLRWTAENAALSTAVRLVRRRLGTGTGATGVSASGTGTAKSAKPPSERNLLAPGPEPIVRNLLVEIADPAGDGRAVDRTVHAEATEQEFEYRAQRVIRQQIGAQTLELTGPLSAAVRVGMRDVYAPDRPTGLAAVAVTPSTAETPGREPQREAAKEAAKQGIDLSWQPSVQSGLLGPVAGYVVYRREDDAGEWHRISGTPLIVGPAFSDARAEPGHAYTYAVTAVGANGRESSRSEPASESMPAP